MSLHLSSFLGHFCTLFLSLREKFFDFLHCGADAFGNVLVSDALNPPNFINGHSVNVVHPKPAELCFRQLVPDLRNHRGSHSAPLRFLVLALHNHINGRNGKCGFGQIINGRIVYNADGLRVQKTVNGVVTGYTLHGKNVVHMTKGNDELHFFYDAQNRPAVVVYNGTAYAYVKSLQGDVIALLDGTGNVVVSYVYDAWGMPIGKSGTLTETLGTLNPFRYRGYVFDEETGLYYLRSRYYNPGWGRFVNADCIYSANCFAYCENAPIAFFDEDGMKMSLKIGFDDCDFVTRLMLGGAGGGFSYSGRCEDISSCASIDRAARAYEEQWTNSLYNTYSDTFKYTCGNNATPEMLKETATKAANKYIEENPGKGAVHGTKGHTYAENEIKQLQWENVKTEVSFKNTKQVDYGTPGSIRLDVVIVDGFGRPTYAIDFKFGNAPLTQTRINQILQNLPTKITIEKVP